MGQLRVGARVGARAGTKTIYSHYITLTNRHWRVSYALLMAFRALRVLIGRGELGETHFRVQICLARSGVARQLGSVPFFALLNLNSYTTLDCGSQLLP